MFDVWDIMKGNYMAGRPGRPKRTEEVTSLLLRLPPALLSKLDRCKAVLELREGGSLTRTSVLGRALDAGADVLMGEGEDHHLQTCMVPTRGVQPAEVQPANMRQPRHEHEGTETVPEEVPEEAREDQRQTENTVPDYNTSKYTLGKLCPQGHEWGTTGQSLLSLDSRTCKECKLEHNRRKRKERR
jgi:hypothetical protein